MTKQELIDLLEASKGDGSGLNFIFNNGLDIAIMYAKQLTESPQSPCGICDDMNNQSGDIQLWFAVKDMPEVPEYKSRMLINYCPSCGRLLATDEEILGGEK